MKKMIFLASAVLVFNSCVVRTATKVVSGAVSLSYKAVKGTVNGISWAVSKAKGKIDEDRLDGTWKVVGVYKGSLKIFQRIRILMAHLPQNVQKVLIKLFLRLKSLNSSRCTAVHKMKIG